MSVRAWKGCPPRYTIAPGEDPGEATPGDLVMSAMIAAGGVFIYGVPATWKTIISLPF